MLVFTMTALNLSLVEIIVLQLGAIILGIAIHFFIISRRNLTGDASQSKKLSRQFEDWKMKYFNEAEIREKELAESRLQAKEATDNARMYTAELEDLRRQNKKLQAELDIINEQSDTDSQEELEKEVFRLEQLLGKTEQRNEQLNQQLEKAQQQVKDYLQQAPVTTSSVQDKEKDDQIASLQSLVQEKETKSRTYEQQITALQQRILHLESALQSKPVITTVQEPKNDYLEELRQTQLNLQAENDKISQLLSQIDKVKDHEQKQQEMNEENESLQQELAALKMLLKQKEEEINHIREKEHLAIEMSSMLENAYTEFNTLQTKMQRLESQVSASKMMNMEYEDLKETHLRISHELEQQRSRWQAQLTENQALKIQLGDLEEKLKEAEFHRQQLQKRVNYLEELNQDLHTMSDANKKLENQLKSIGELESKLQMIAEERDQLLRRQLGQR